MLLRCKVLILLITVIGGFSMQGSDTYVIKKGDSLYKIALKYSVTVPEILADNPGLSPKHLKQGSMIRIPTRGVPEYTPKIKATQTIGPVYTVKPGDTFTSIARKMGTTVTSLKRANPEVNPTRLKPGQPLRLSPVIVTSPAVDTVHPSHSTTLRPRVLETADKRVFLFVDRIKSTLDSVPVERRRWKYIVIHHSGTKEGNARLFDYYHRRVRGMENGLAYHFVIGNGVDSGDGEIEAGPRWMRQIKGGHVKEEAMNKVALGICLVGNFEEGRPSKNQILSILELIRYLNSRCGMPYPKVYVHREINARPTACPGEKFPIKEIREILKESPL